MWISELVDYLSFDFVLELLHEGKYAPGDTAPLSPNEDERMQEN